MVFVFERGLKEAPLLLRVKPQGLMRGCGLCSLPGTGSEPTCVLPLVPGSSGFIMLRADSGACLTNPVGPRLNTMSVFLIFKTRRR